MADSFPFHAIWVYAFIIFDRTDFHFNLHQFPSVRAGTWGWIILCTTGLNHRWFCRHRRRARIRIPMWGGQSRSNLVWKTSVCIHEGPKGARCWWSIIEPMRVYFRLQIHKNASFSMFCVHDTCTQIIVSPCTSCTLIIVDHILELSFTSFASYWFKRSPGICHAFWEPNKNADQRWLPFKGFWLEPDWFVTATVLCRRLCLFGCLTLGIPPRSPDAVPDPFLPDDDSQASLWSMYLSCQCTIAADGVFQSIDNVTTGHWVP